MSIEIKQPKHACDICGRDCTELCGLEIELKDETGKIQEIKDIRKLFGKTEFSICFTCWLLALGIRPKEGGSE